MALTQTQVELGIIPDPISPSTPASPKSQTLQSILIDVPYVDTSFDLSLASSKYLPPQLVEASSPTSNASKSKHWSEVSENALFNLEKELKNTHIQLRGEPAPSQVSMDAIAQSIGLLNAAKDNIATWAPIAHSLALLAAGLKRDTAAFASSLKHLLNSHIHLTDPLQFTNQFHQLREAYSMLLMQHELQTTHQTTLKPTNTPKTNDEVWDDRQLVDSFMTLIRTSPGFIASALNEMDQSELDLFCAYVDGSPLNVLFHGVLGNSRKFRPAVLAEIVEQINIQQLETFLKACLTLFLMLCYGTINSNQKLTLLLKTKLHSMPLQTDFSVIFKELIPEELIAFIKTVFSNTKKHSHQRHLILLNCINTCLTTFLQSVLTNPHQFGILLDTFIGDYQTQLLDALLVDLSPTVAQFTQQIIQNACVIESAPLWQQDELIVVKGSDIILMFNSLLPNRQSYDCDVNTSLNTSNTFTTNDEDEWCLQSIRNDLVPVMHTLSTSVDGWQVFKVCEDGLVSDVDSEMGFVPLESNKLEFVCEAIAKFDLPTPADRILEASKHAKLSGDFFTSFNLDSYSLKELNLDELTAFAEKSADTYRLRMQSLRRTLDNAAHDQRQQLQRLSNLISILDSNRMHVWYATEARLNTNFTKSREFLKLLYPRHRQEEAELNDLSLFANNSNADNSTVSKRRLSILSTYSTPESPFISNNDINGFKLSDKEVDKVLLYMKQHGIKNALYVEERFHRALVEIALLARKLLDRDHLASYTTFKRDKHFQYQFSQQQQQSNLNNTLKRSSQRHRRSSLGLFDFFDTSNQSQQNISLHTATSTQLLGLSASHESLRQQPKQQPQQQQPQQQQPQQQQHHAFGPPTWPTISELQSLLLSDIGVDFVFYGSDTDKFMDTTGRMVLGGDSSVYQPLIEQIMLQSDPNVKLVLFTKLHSFAKLVLLKRTNQPPTRAEVISELSKSFCREFSSLFADIQTVLTLADQQQVHSSCAFSDVVEASQNTLQLVVVKSVDYAQKFLRYCMETTSSRQPQRMAMMGITDAVSIYAFCAKARNREAMQRLCELYLTFPSIKVDMPPLKKITFDDNFRQQVAHYWLQRATH